MGEYQYYEFLAIDRPLDGSQLDALRLLSTRAQITPVSFVNSYSWGSFRGDPRVLMERYFDAFLYLASWGSRQLTFRVPGRLLDLEVARQYYVGDCAHAWEAGGNVILDVSTEDEAGDWETDGSGLLAGIASVRAELMSGDLRALYLAWLACVQADQPDRDEPEPPVPAGLGTLSAALRGLVDFLRIDEDLLAVATVASRPLVTVEPSATALAQWVRALPPADKDAALSRVLAGDGLLVRAEMLRSFCGDLEPESGGNGTAGPRTSGQLIEAAAARRAERVRVRQEQEAAERARRERAAAVAREQHLQTLAASEEQAWQRVATLIDTKRPREYDTAVELLRDLHELSGRGGGAGFPQRLQVLREQHRGKPSLIRRLDDAGLGNGAASD
jgi:hypothetical protein